MNIVPKRKDYGRLYGFTMYYYDNNNNIIIFF